MWAAIARVIAICRNGGPCRERAQGAMSRSILSAPLTQYLDTECPGGIASPFARAKVKNAGLAGWGLGATLYTPNAHLHRCALITPTHPTQQVKPNNRMALAGLGPGWLLGCQVGH